MRARVVLYNPKMKAVLLIHRIKDQRAYWVLPGGGAKGAETPLQAAVREVEEELGLKLAPTSLQQLAKVEDHGEE
ncbi:NUDIX domain-containing protein [Lactobacillus xylocopicola]|uniref:Nudix hydrolase domain-containing protein n=1 Tax=Lactobacillus xylocopicola TaxID=2976676 RepID=A0ABN6SL62_9LACO|nr:NUDIX domain-containing protein [Lactobacillus xylocopicola]BDR61030.1 hypothetical protein KIM322_12910 [Lactobacillus xylocopicola]